MIVVTPVFDKTLSESLKLYTLSKDFLVKTFLDLKDPISQSTNWDRIKRKYSAKELSENESKYPNDTVLIKSGTQLEIRTSFLKRDPARGIPPDVFKTAEFKPFVAAQMMELLRNPTYSRIVNSYSGEKIADIVNNDITVYVWCRALSAPNSTAQEGAWLNISAFIQDITISKDDIGTFSFTLPPVMCEWSEFFGWGLSSDVVGYSSGSVRDDVLTVTSTHQYNPRDPGYFWREKFLFNTVLQPNDLVYIRFEKLEIDQELDSQLREVHGKLGDTDIPNRTYDMIGLIDAADLRSAPQLSVTGVHGRDLMKLLIEDGSYFFPEQFAQEIFTDANSILTKRNKIELVSQSLAGASYTFKTVQTILKFIFNKFSNIGIIPNSAFNGYGNRSIKNKYQLKSSSLTSINGDVMDILNDSFLKEERQGLWRICELVFDPQVANRVLADNSVAQDNGSIINSIRKICQEPFIEFYGDTFKDKFYFIVRKQPFDTNGYRGLVYDDIESERESFSANAIVGPDTKQADAIRKKLDVERRLALTGRASGLSDLVIDIDDVDVLSEPELTYHDESYSWYRLIPRGLGIVDEAASFQLAPVVPFDEYAEVWGNRMLTMEYQYAPTEYLLDSEFNSQAKYAERQTFFDLQFLVQSNQYLPFTRQGTIVLTGNRLIKRGLFIFYRPTNEVFYVNTVTHVRSIDGAGQNRQTILRVSRGMREPYIRGKLVQFPSGPKTVSYFDIIKTDISANGSINDKDFLKNWRVDKDIFNFFIQRRQWVD